MKPQKRIFTLLEILKKHNLVYGNILHICIYTRDLESFNNLKNESLLNEKHNNLTPIELAKKLNYTEFYTNDERSNTIRTYYLNKYLNPISGYQIRKLKLTKDSLQSYSKKITNIDLNECTTKKVDNKILIKHNGKTHKFKGKQEDIDELYGLICDYDTRAALSEDANYKDYYYVFLSNVLVEIIGDKELRNIVGDILPEYVDENVVETFESSETYCSIVEEEFFDVEENTL